MQSGTRADFDLLDRQIVALLGDERSFLANSANFAAFIFDSLPQVNWSGFYFPHPDALVLGPFAGKPACTRLPNGHGVCGKSFTTAATIVVDDVNRFEDHIVCDSASRSELVIPLLKDGGIFGVFDIDSPIEARFSEEDRRGIERLVLRYLEHTPMPQQYRYELDGTQPIAGRIDLQTCRDHHVVLRYLMDDLSNSEDARISSDVFARFRTVLVAHLRLEDNWLYPRLTASPNHFVSERAGRYRQEMGGLRSQFEALWKRWSPPDAIAHDFGTWRRDWEAFSERLETRMHAEDEDLYATAEADVS